MLQGDRGYVLCVLEKKKKANVRAREGNQEQTSRENFKSLKLQVGKVPGLPWLPKFPGFSTTLTFILNYLCSIIITLKD